MGHSRWNLLPPVPEGHALYSCGYSRLITQLLYNRGFSSPAEVSPFLAADSRLAADPFLLPGMHQAVGRIYRALLSGEKIAVYGDFDTDGITSTALLVEGLTMLDCHAVPYIPHRLTEGYGVKVAALENLQRQGVSLVITVDCGITAVTEIKRARKMGLDVIVTDHHTPLADLPSAVAVVDPKLPDSRYPFVDLAGVGVALKLLQALFQGMGKERCLDGLADLVALGTVADMMPLVGENRYLVSQGLKLINTSPRLGLIELAAQSRRNGGGVDSETISWIIAPRLNAAGRLDHAMGSYRLLTTHSPDEARELAVWLEQKNTERQNLTGKYLAKAREQVTGRALTPLLFAADSEFPSGICGLIAGRLSEEFYRPVIAVKTGYQFSGGSCRSIPEFNIIRALNRCRNLFTHFGGHAQAAGFTMMTRNLPYLEEAMQQMATEELAGVDLRPRLDIEAEVRLAELGGDTFATLQKLAPFGQGNPAPIFLARRVEPVDCRPMGNGDHLRLCVRQGSAIWDAVAFNLGRCLGEVVSPLDVVFSLERDNWNGNGRLRMNVLDFAPAGD
ncbi:MAG: single-stranded-DNA-specific exonuclease RecJ [Chloroflexi bacterium]|nr:single-stranded-DNA-specific exonuclease RecJ [Chloroflexota bacterium]